MTIEEHSRRRVAAALDRLEREYADFEEDARVVEKTWHHSPEAYERVRDRFEAGTVGGAGAWTTDDEGRVLLVRHEGETAWSDPGGKQEPGELLEAAARRETREESGVEVKLTGVRQVHRVEIRAEGEVANGENDREEVRPPIHRLIVIFDGEYVGGEVRPREGEIAEVRWWRERPDELLYDELAEFPIPAAE
ncbi:NUDIX domain-containing protein [Halorussus salinus]|uniref:NUDIX domain-containing protein n=1 Tax=Halorussus salinus TaxID=1364935 RepID=UPI0010928012|nr:NUDIX domain-containing protein [Halorussus salinus]